MARLQGKVAVITGGADGIGAATARRFVNEGAKVLLVDVNEEALARTASSIGPHAACFVGDVSADAVASSYVAEALRRFGKVDIGVLNAGIEGSFGRIDELSVDTFDRVMAVNVRGVWLGLAALMPAMRATGGGSIVVTSSVAGLRGAPNLAAYGASKHAVIGLMKSAALEGISSGIRVNAINPAPIQTRMLDAIDEGISKSGMTISKEARVPIGRYGDPSEVASLMLFLASDESSFCTGATYLIDGGSMSGL